MFGKYNNVIDMEVLEILRKLKKQNMLSKEHLEFHGVPIEGPFFNLFAKFEDLGFEESPIPRSENMMFMRNPSDDNDMAIMAAIGEPSMLAYEIREMFPVKNIDAEKVKEEKLSELKRELQTVDVPSEESERLLVMKDGKYTGVITAEIWETEDDSSYVAVTYTDAQCRFEHENKDFE